MKHPSWPESSANIHPSSLIPIAVCFTALYTSQTSTLVDTSHYTVAHIFIWRNDEVPAILIRLLAFMSEFSDISLTEFHYN